MDLTLASAIGLALLYFLSLAASFAFKIQRDSFYYPLHFAGGFLTASFLFGLFSERLGWLAAGSVRDGAIIVALTLGVGILWELYEWLAWKLFLKAELFRPKLKDTIADLALDVLGGAAALAILLTLSS